MIGHSAHPALKGWLCLETGSISWVQGTQPQKAGACLSSKDLCFSFKSGGVLGTGHSSVLETGLEEG